MKLYILTLALLVLTSSAQEATKTEATTTTTTPTGTETTTTTTNTEGTTGTGTVATTNTETTATTTTTTPAAFPTERNTNGPAIVTALLGTGIDAALYAYLPLAQCKATQLSYPSFDYFGYTFSDVKITSLEFDQSQTHMYLKDGMMTVDVKNAKATMTAVATAKMGGNNEEAAATEAIKSQTNGEGATTNDVTNAAQNLNIVLSDVSMTMDVTPTMADDGRAGVTFSNMVTNIGNMEVTGGSGIFATYPAKYNSNPKMQEVIGGRISNFLLPTLQNQVNSYTNMYPLQNAIPMTPMSIDVRMVKAPTVTSKFLSENMNGTVFVTANPYSNMTETPVTLPTSDDSASQNYQVFISDFVFNSALHNLWANNMLAGTFPDMLQQKNVPISSWTTDTIDTVIPGFATQYGAGNNVKFMCNNNGATAPSLKSTDKEIEGTSYIACVMNVVGTDGVLQTALDFNAIMSSTGSVNIDSTGSNVEANMATAKLSDVNIITNNINGQTNDQLIAGLNTIIEKNMPYNRVFSIPTNSYVMMQDPTVQYKNGYIAILSSAKFMPMTC